MISNIQPLDNIQPAEKKKEKQRSSDPVQAEYDDGREFLQNKEVAQAALAFHNALLGFEEKGNQDGIANACNQLGNICLEKGDFEKALSHYQRAWEICDRFDDPMSLLSLSKQMVAAHRGLEDYAEALRISLDMLESHDLNNNPQGTVETMECMAEIFLAQGEKEKAADAFRTISSIHANYKHKKIAAKYEAKANELAAS